MVGVALDDSEGDVAETVCKLQATIDAMEKQRADDRKLLVDNARRIDMVEA